VVQAVALARVVDRSLLHHASLVSVRPDLIAVALAVRARATLTWWGERSAQYAADHVVATLQVDLVHQVISLGPAWLAGERPGELSLTATRGLQSLHTYFSRYLPQAAAAALVPVILLAWVATQDWLSLVVALALVGAIPITMIYFGREATKRTARQWRRLGSLAGRFLQLIEGLPTLRAFGREAHGRREVEASTEGVRVATMRTLRVAFLSALSMDLIAGFGVGFVAMVLGLRLLWGELSLTTAMAVLLVAPEIFVPLRRAGAEFHASTEGQAAAERVLAILDIDEPSAAPVASRLARPARPARPAPPTTAVPGPATLLVEHLSVSYEHRADPALSDLSLVVPPGSRIALIGPSGSGKSTVLSALLGFTQPSAGTRSINGLEFAQWERGAWGAHFSWVPQRPHLFAASLGENLRLGATSASEAELEAVLGAVGLGPLLAHLPEGLNSEVGQNGLTLSAGERQRVALARALLRPAPILVLDEPTSALDLATSEAVGAAIAPWVGDRTVIVAAHQPQLLPAFDTVLELHRQTALPR
jgi:ATP-binding cassette subfamily C protein CydD